MKRIIINCLLLGAFLTFSTNADAQSIGKKLKQAIEDIKDKTESKSTEATESTDTESTESEEAESTEESSSSSKKHSLSDLLSGKKATKENLVGTWVYKEPAVVLSSSNILKDAGGKLASSATEKELKEEFEKLGIKEGCITMVFDEDGNFTQDFSGKSMKGTYSVDDGEISLKYGGLLSQFGFNTELDGKNLLLVMDATKLLSLVNTLGKLSGNSLLSSVTSLLDSMDGLECGFKRKKEE